MIQNINNKIFLIENFIDNKTCNFLINSITNYAVEDPKRPGFKIALNLNTRAAINLIENLPILPSSSNKDYQIAIDKITEIINKIINTISDFYNIEYTLKTFCYTEMHEGTSNRVHADNKYLSQNGEIKDRPTEIEDKSVLIYLNDSYIGGEIYFPKLNASIKPKPGTLIFFEGNEETIHGVNMVNDGVRINLIGFLWPFRYAGKMPEIIDGVETLEFPINTF
jgi:hypothetical protein